MAGHGINHNAIAGYDATEHIINGVIVGNTIVDGTLDMNGKSIIFDVNGDSYIKADADDVIAVYINGVVSFHFETDVLHAHDAAGVFIPDEIIVDSGFDDSGAWTPGTYWSISSSKANYDNPDVAGVHYLYMNPVPLILPNRDYIVCYDITSISGNSTVGVRAYVGIGTGAIHTPGGGTGSITEVINSGASAQGPKLWATRGGGGALYFKIDNFSVRLLPVQTSRAGDLTVHNSLTVGQNIIAPSADVAFHTIATQQVDQFSGSLSNFMELVGGSSLSPGSKTQGSSGIVTAGNGNIPNANGEGGDGGDLVYTTGDGGAGYAIQNDGHGGVFNIILGAKGGTTGSPKDGQFIIEDDSANDMFVVGVDGLGFWGVTPITQEVLATGAGKVVDDVITALQNVGLVSQT